MAKVALDPANLLGSLKGEAHRTDRAGLFVLAALVQGQASMTRRPTGGSQRWVLRLRCIAKRVRTSLLRSFSRLSTIMEAIQLWRSWVLAILGG